MQSNHCSYGPASCIDRLRFTSHEITVRQELVAGCDALALGLLRSKTDRALARLTRASDLILL
jgi:hypothetical protein